MEGLPMAAPRLHAYAAGCRGHDGVRRYKVCAEPPPPFGYY